MSQRDGNYEDSMTQNQTEGEVWLKFYPVIY